MPDSNTFLSTTHAVRVHAGDQALSYLPYEVDRLGARRAMILCGRSVANKTELLPLLADLLGERLVGVFGKMGKDAPLPDIQAAVANARQCRADILVAVGAGSVLKAARVVDILLSEPGDLDSLVTQYPDNGRPVSPKLRSTKLPIINILTAGTSAQNRGGAAVKDVENGRRLEFFDPKTRPAAIFWDDRALLTAPPELAFTTGLSVYWRSLMNICTLADANPLVEGSRRQALRLSRRAMPRLRNEQDAAARIDICAAALLQNRDEDDGGRPFDAHWIARVVYALVAATLTLVDSVDQGSANAVYTAPVIREFGHLCPDIVAALAETIEMDAIPSGRGTAHALLAEHFEKEFSDLGVPRHLRDLGVARHMLDEIVKLSLLNFNADRNRELGSHQGKLRKIVYEAW
ncbi:iron-containing alcohol dehydrogenase [Allopusillimonas soli]|uniref:Iron-containing alcohol dehydrogenase n=1 Tax=Allopusillimonas soli TaxID=659016 RepID=A0A853F742_9BURK|nr:iron-containing alcohol dehydrogenase [Allopusillimonas soli]NYT36405.1 iron-containing alcohol dehydrogenase [Allopusillimonas soli]TEA74917.1 iron-containing alcohol dehydrogenase [Allopusillimonas soli]